MNRFPLLILLALPLSAQTPDRPIALQCEKYQHVVPAHNESCNHGANLSNCTFTVPDQCVDDMHQVTEREWQEIVTIDRDRIPAPDTMKTDAPFCNSKQYPFVGDRYRAFEKGSMYRPLEVIYCYAHRQETK